MFVCLYALDAPFHGFEIFSHEMLPLYNPLNPDDAFFFKGTSPPPEFDHFFCQHWTNSYCFWLWVGKSGEEETHKKCCYKKKRASYTPLFFSKSVTKGGYLEWYLLLVVIPKVLKFWKIQEQIKVTLIPLNSRISPVFAISFFQ